MFFVDSAYSISRTVIQNPVVNETKIKFAYKSILKMAP